MGFRAVSALLLLALLVTPAVAQNIPRDEYLHYIPLESMSPKPGTEANAELGLFGDEADPDYLDVDPRDGIDDRRGRVFRDLAVRFAPIMVLNTNNIPVDHRWYSEGPNPFPLVVDRWDISGTSPSIVRSDSLDWRDLGTACDAGNEADCRFQALLERYHPYHPEPLPGPTYATDPRFFEVLFVDFPGEDESSWKKTFQEALDQPGADARLPLHYVHPFAVRAGDGAGPPAYRLVLQYWFFYPYNDGGNNHEGDWEHVNLVLGPLSRVGETLGRDEILRIIDGDWPADDPLVIHELEYYFHHQVVSLDFSEPNAYAPRKEWEEAVARIPEERAGEHRLLRTVRYVAFEDEAETRINTHPVVFIGADNKGTDQILAPPGGKNRDPHGSYPLSGMYKDIGPAGATEQVATTFDHREWLADGGPDRPLDADRGKAVSFARPERMRIVPDWERILPLVEAEPEARRDWGWLVLPLRWGYPASVSPFAGVVEHAETGNLAVPGPAFNAGWGRLGATPGFSEYEPHMIYSLFPLGWQDNFQNDLGYLNLTYPTWIVFPPLDIAWRLVSAPFRLFIKKEGPIFYPKEDIPYRFFGVSAGYGTQTIPEDFTNLFANDQQFDEWLVRLALHVIADTSAALVTAEESITRRETASAQLVFFIGDRFSTENTFSHARPLISNRYVFDTLDTFETTMELNLWDYMGSFRYALTGSRLSPYARVGYGLSWYRLENVSTNGVPLGVPDSDWILRLNGNLGAGAEWLAVRSRDRRLFPGLDLAFRAEWTMVMHKLGLNEDRVPLKTLVNIGFQADQIPRNEMVFRHQFVFRALLTW